MGHILGIDLGTMNCCMAVIKDGQPQVIPISDKNNTLPSYLHQSRDGSYIVGHEAKKLAPDARDRTVYAAKRLIGRKFNTPEVEKAQNHYPYTITEGENYDVKLKLGNSELTPQTVSGELLKQLKDTASKSLGEEITEAIITVPAYFNNNQRKATKEAGQMAGLKVLRLLNEPTAAALAYGFNQDMNKTIAIYDLGGGTFDISILRIQNDVFEVIGTNGDSYLGGIDFDTRIAEFFIKEYLEQGGNVEIIDELITRRVIQAAEEIKLELSEKGQITFELSTFFKDDDDKANTSFKLTRKRLEELSRDLVDRTIQLCEATLKEINLEKDQIDEVILVGGQTRMPLVQKAVTDFFEKTPNQNVNPDEVVAMGAAIQGALLGDAESDTLLLDVTPLSLGIATYGDNFSKLIEKNTKIPCNASHTFRTVRDFQDKVRIVVHQGEMDKASANMLLGEFILTGIRKARRLEPKIDVNFRIDSDGLLEVSAKDQDTEKEQTITIKDFLETEAETHSDAAYQANTPPNSSQS